MLVKKAGLKNAGIENAGQGLETAKAKVQWCLEREYKSITYNLLSLNDLTSRWFGEGSIRSSAVGTTTRTGRVTIFLPRSSTSIQTTCPTRSCSALLYVRMLPEPLVWEFLSLSSSILSSDIESSSSDSEPDLYDSHMSGKRLEHQPCMPPGSL